jgi:DNA-binding winged helix-turn-helix (wHTH) protein/Tol biopolymer transport system component
LETQRFEFCDFVLDSRQGVLLKSGEPVPVTPKTLDLLQVLLQKRGNVVGKDELMRSVWRDSFVAEGNLAFTVRLLRKALNDDKQNPRFIETVPRRGYRFIAEVREASADNGAVDSGTPASEARLPDDGARPGVRFRLAAALAALILAVAAITGVWFAGSRAATSPVLSVPFSSEKLSTNGNVFSAAVSPDGKMVVYSNRAGGKQSVWIRQLESANNIQIIPPSDDSYYAFAFSPAADFLYFSRRAKGTDEQTEIYRVSILGGVPTRIAAQTQGWLSVSPDGEKISFVRCFYEDDEFCSLWIADSKNGRNERKLASRPRPLRIGDNEISPDGRSVAFAVGQSENAANEFSLARVDIETGAEREITPEKFFNIKNLAWLPGTGDVLITAARIPNKHFRIWQVSSADGSVKPLTKDSETYSVLSVDKAAASVISTQVTEDFRIRLFGMDGHDAGRVLAEGEKVAIGPDSRVFFSSSMSGNSEIWSISNDGADRRQLTTDAADDLSPVVSADRSQIFFASNRSGEAHVWRMNPDGTNQMQITQENGGYPLFITPDGNWLYYHHGIHRTLWRVFLKTSAEEMVWDQPKYFFAFSPDGSQFAFSEKRGDEKVVVIVSAADKRVVKEIKYPDQKARMLELKWLPDGKGMVYVMSNTDYEQNALWLQPFDGGPARKIVDLGDDEIEHFALAPDGKSFAVAQGGWRHDALLIKGLR